MRRQVLFAVAVIILVASFVARASNGIELRGFLSANDTEMQEGYFAVAQDTVLMVRPGSDLHHWLRAHAGRTVRIVVEPADTQ